MPEMVYRLVVKGELGPLYAAAFEEMAIVPLDGETALVGAVTDQAHLQGLLERISRVGLTLVSVAPEPDA
jgi:hypothetical protein